MIPADRLAAVLESFLDVDQFLGRQDAIGEVAALILGLMSLPLVFAAPQLVWPFSDDPEVRLLAASMLAIMGAFLVFDGLQFVFASALRSLGEQVWAGVNGILGFFLVTGGLGGLLVARGWGADGLAWAAGAGMLVCAALNYGRLWWVLSRPGRSSG